MINPFSTQKSKKIFFICSLVYNFFWAIGKIFFGIFSFSFVFCISGVYCLLLCFIKSVYYKSQHIEDKSSQIKKSQLINILLILAGIMFAYYSTKFGEFDSTSYGLIPSITIATFSFAELGFAIFNTISAHKSKDRILISFRGCNLATAGFALSFTQIALLDACGTQNNFLNMLTGTMFGVCAVFIGVFLIYQNKKADR